MTSRTIEEMIGVTMTNVWMGDAQLELIFTAQDGRQFKFHHSQDCCEYVRIEDVVGELNWLVGSPIVFAEESTSQGTDEYGDSQTWTFYRYSTVNGTVTVRWLGESNGYYSESVDMTVVAASV